MSTVHARTDVRASLHLTPPVRVEVVRCDDLQPETLGSGTLMDQLELGARIQISLGGKVLRTSPLSAVTPIDENTVEIQTANRSYRLVRATGANRQLMEATRKRLDELRARSRRPGGRARMETGLTSTGQVATPAKRSAGSFCSGADVRVTRIRGADALLEANGILGRGKLLDDVAIGACARFSLEDGSTIATSPVRSMERLGTMAVQISTGNSTYRLDLVQ